MREIGTGQAGIQNFSRAQWDKAATAEGEVRLRRGGAEGDVLYSSTRTLGGRFVGGLRDLVSSRAANDGRRAQKAADAKQAVAELRTYLGPHADRILSQAGLSDHTRLTTDHLREVLRLADGLVVTAGEVRGEKNHHGGATFKNRLDDPSTFMSHRKMRALENDVVKIFDKNKDGTDRNAPGAARFEDLRDRTIAYEAAKPPLEAFTAGAQAARAVARYDGVVRRGPDDDTSKALKLAIEVKTLAHGIALNELNNGRGQNAVARMLFRAHSGEFKQAYTPGQLKLAEQLSSNTVLMDLAAGRTTVDKAMLAVRTMAQKTGLTPDAMLRLMGDQFDAEVGSLSRADVQANQVLNDGGEGGDFQFSEVLLSGDIITQFYDDIVRPGTDHSGGPIDYADTTRDRFTDLGLEAQAWGTETGLESVDAMIDGALLAAKARADAKGDGSSWKAGERPRPLPWVREQHTKLFDDIRSPGQVDRLKPVAGVVPLPGEEGSRGITERQYALIREVRAESAGGRAPDGTAILPLRDRPIAGTGATPKQEVLARMVQRYGLSSTAQAETILQKAEDWLKTAPITLTIPADAMFKDGPGLAYGTAYTATQERNTRFFDSDKVDALLGGAKSGDALNIPVSSRATGRGENYLAWRTEKDAEETRHAGLTRSEQAKFAAVNPNFDKSKGFEGESSSYGYVHLLLKPEVRDRALYNFNKTRELRSDATMMIYDMIQDRNSGGDRMPQMDAIVHNALGLPGYVNAMNLHFEVEIFGDLDLVGDVQEVRVPELGMRRGGENVTTEAINSNVRTFYESRGVPVDTWGAGTLGLHKKVVQGSEELKGLVQAALV